VRAYLSARARAAGAGGDELRYAYPEYLPSHRTGERLSRAPSCERGSERGRNPRPRLEGTDGPITALEWRWCQNPRARKRSNRPPSLDIRRLATFRPMERWFGLHGARAPRLAGDHPSA
jgi:hypothetical protein